MTVELVLAAIVVVVALGFDYTNGFHDAANAIATSVSTRALTPRVALIMAAVMNMVGALLSTDVAQTIAHSIVKIDDVSGTPTEQTHLQLIVVLGGLVGAVVWNLITWRLGLPSSSSHALIGGLVGSGLVALGISGVLWGNVLDKVVIPMVVSPITGFVLAYLLMVAVLWIFKNAAPTKTFRRFRVAQTISAAAMALGHGLQDAQKTMGVIFMALIALDPALKDQPIPWWVKIAAAAAISAGTASGGWRIMRTLGRRVIELDPARGFVAESVAAGVLYTTAFVVHAPISTTHTITSAIMGVGATKRLSAVRWGVAGNIATAWILTIPAAAAVAALVTWILSLTFGLT